jgi:hypothetical protein
LGVEVEKPPPDGDPTELIDSPTRCAFITADSINNRTANKVVENIFI